MTEIHPFGLVLEACFGPSETGVFTRLWRKFGLSAKRRQSVGKTYGTTVHG